MGITGHKARILLGTAAVALTASAASGALAQDKTEAGTVVSNTFTLTYEGATGGTQTITNDTASTTDADSNGIEDELESASFRVDRLINVTVTKKADDAIALTDIDGQLEWTVKNDGNDNQRFSLDVEALTNGSSRSMGGTFALTYYVDADGNGVRATDGSEPLVTYVDATVGTYPALAPGETAVVIAVGGTVPTAAVNGETLDVALLATTYQPATYADGSTGGTSAEAEDTDGNNPLVTENVFADASGPATGDDDTNPDGKHSASATFTISVASLSAAKAVYMYDPTASCGTTNPPAVPATFTQAYAVPGACAVYAIEVSNGTGAGTASNIAISDGLPEGITFVSAGQTGFSDTSASATVTVTSPSASCKPAPESSPGAGDAVTCTVSLANGLLAGGSTGTLIIRATINE